MQVHSRPKKYKATNHCYAGMESMMSSENLDARITENGALDRKMLALEALKGKMVFLGGSRGILEF
jgi:hypothetical protein